MLIAVGFLLGLVDRTDLVLCGTIEAIELESLGLKRINCIVSGSGRNNDGKTIGDSMCLAIHDNVPFTSFEPDELTQVVSFFSDFFTCSQAHQHWQCLAVKRT